MCAMQIYATFAICSMKLIYSNLLLSDVFSEFFQHKIYAMHPLFHPFSILHARSKVCTCLMRLSPNAVHILCEPLYSSNTFFPIVNIMR